MTLPVLQSWTNPFGLPPFHKIEDADFAPAFDAALSEARRNIQAIVENAAPPDFANTIDALERSDHQLSQVSGVFFNLIGTMANPTLEGLQRDLSPTLAKFHSETMMNDGLFRRIDSLYQARETLALSDEQARVLHLTHRSFLRSGAGLKGADRTRLADVTERLARLGTSFTQNLLADERSWVMWLTETDLDGLPDTLIDAARAAAEERNGSGYAITLSRSLIVPFLQYSTRRDLRETAMTAWQARGANGGETDNRAIVKETLELRQERARLLGYDSFSDFKLATEMAGTPDKVRDLLMAVWDPARAQAATDAAILTEMLHQDGVNGPLEAWDWRHYSERRRKAEHDLDETELKPYFQIDRMIDAAFDVAGRLFDLSFHNVDAPLYHPDARVWEVRRGDQHMGVFIGDYFARPSKRSGAWCSRFRPQSKLDGEVRPIVVNVCNFAKAPKDRPNLLTFDDARTLFHEFGHALHTLLSDVTYASISGTSVSRDFVELPSQLYEHWLTVPEILKAHAIHAGTGHPIPDDLLKRLLAAQSYDMGFQTVEYTASALVDLAYHSGPAPKDPLAFERDVLQQIGLPHAIPMRHATPHFAHVFAGDGYSSGYYSYMWSEVMDADAFAAFDETGNPFDKAMAEALEANIYSAGGSEEAEELYMKFRGRMPGVGALLRGRGLVTP